MKLSIKFKNLEKGMNLTRKNIEHTLRNFYMKYNILLYGLLKMEKLVMMKLKILLVKS